MPLCSEPTVVQPVNQVVAIARTASRGLQHSALNFIGLIHGFKVFREPPDAFTGAADRQQEQKDGEYDGAVSQRDPHPWAGGDHRQYPLPVI